MKISFGFGKGFQNVEVPNKNLIDVLRANNVESFSNEEDEIIRSLVEPIGSKRLRVLAKGKHKVVIITSDITRPMPTYKVMPFILNELYDAGVKKEEITLVFALGSHRKHTKEEMVHLVGKSVFEEIKCVDSDCDDYINMGQTTLGTPIKITRVVAEADFRICLGNIEYHYFAGYSGGAKAIMPGVSTNDAIQSNHKMMINPECKAGEIENNSLRQDIDEAGKIVGIDFILNVVLNEKKEIIKAVSGHYLKAHRQGCVFLDEIYKIKIKEKADIVIVSQGGAPKDLNLYQTQKALDNAKHAIKENGIIILIGSCKEGLGNSVFEDWMINAPTSKSMIKRIEENFELGGHKAAAIAMVLEKADVYLVSDLDNKLVKNIFLKPYKNAQKAFDDAFKKIGSNATVIAMPYGGSTLPVVE